MSRSFGDSIVHSLGVSCEPEITEHEIDTNDAFLICATDGVWDVIDNNQAVQIVHTHLTSTRYCLLMSMMILVNIGQVTGIRAKRRTLSACLPVVGGRASHLWLMILQL